MSGTSLPWTAAHGGDASREARSERLALCACFGAKRRVNRTSAMMSEPIACLTSDVSGARLEPREKRGKATRWNEPVRGGDGKEQDAKKPGDQG